MKEVVKDADSLFWDATIEELINVEYMRLIICSLIQKRQLKSI